MLVGKKPATERTIEPRFPAAGICSARLDDYRYYIRMKNITLSADEDLIEQARLVARAQRKTLNAAFQEWLVQFTIPSGSRQDFDSLMRRLRHVKAGPAFSQDNMNER